MVTAVRGTVIIPYKLIVTLELPPQVRFSAYLFFFFITRKDERPFPRAP